MFDDGLFDLFSEPVLLLRDGRIAACSAGARAMGLAVGADAPDTAGYPLRRRFAGADTGGPPPDGHGTPARGRDAPARAAGADRAALRADASGCLPRAANPAGRAVFRRGNARFGVGGAGGFQAPTFDRRLPAGALPAAPPVRPSARLRRRTERRTDAPAREDRALRLFRRPL